MITDASWCPCRIGQGLLALIALPLPAGVAAISEQWCVPPRRQHAGTGAGAAAEITGTKNGPRIKSKIELAVSLRICGNGQEEDTTGAPSYRVRNFKNGCNSGDQTEKHSVSQLFQG